MGEIKDIFENMTRDEIMDELRQAGFNVKDGTGKVTFTDIKCTACGERGVELLKCGRVTDEVKCNTCDSVFNI
ncbi:MAG: hypothetical protein ACI35O_10310 [Bacillaceae bacterium]